MARKNLKWQVHEAVMDSELPPPARLLMFVLSDLADAESGVIPEERKAGASLKELARRTGLGAATVKRHKPDLVALGWLKYDEPTGKQQSSHETGTYTIAVGRNPEPEAQSEPGPEAQPEPPPEAQSEPPEDVQDDGPEAQSEPPGGSERATGEAQSEPPIKGTPTPTSTTDVKASADTAEQPPPAKPKRPRQPRASPKPKTVPDPEIEARHHLAEEIVRWWWNGLKTKPAGKNAWFASVASVEACLKVGWEPKPVADALRAAGSPVSIPRLEIELKRGSRPANPGGPNDQHLADEMAWAQQLEAEEAARQDPNAWEGIHA